MDAQQTDIAAKVSGRIGKILVHEGQTIEMGAPLIEMNTPKSRQNRAGVAAAQQAAEAVAIKAQNGARPQEVEMARELATRLPPLNWRKPATAAADNLAREGLISRQNATKPTPTTSQRKSEAEAAKHNTTWRQRGARSEDKAAAEAQAKQVSAVV